jgi:hypothetical protein
MVAQPDADSHADADAVVDLEAGRPKDCAVCREPADWAAVGPCGHREVCVNCAVRLRFVDRNSQCCICRALCPTVVVTRQQAAGQPQEVDAGSFPKPPLAAGGAGQVGVGLSYHNGMAAYFDDRGQYEKAAMRMCRLEAAARSLGARPSHKVIPILILIVIIALIGCGIGVLVAMHVFGDWLKGTPNPDSTYEVYNSKTLYHKKLHYPMQIFYHGVYLIFLSDLLLPLY